MIESLIVSQRLEMRVPFHLFQLPQISDTKTCKNIIYFLECMSLNSFCYHRKLDLKKVVIWSKYRIIIHVVRKLVLACK